MIEHLQQHSLGAVHLLLALLALIMGTLVLLAVKGRSVHRHLGRGYLLCMLGMNLSGLWIDELYGGFGPFHGLALISLATVLGGWLAVRGKGPGWRHRHAYMMSGSYVGLVAAGVAEVASRVPGWPFGWSVVISSALVILVGLALMQRLLPDIVGSS